MQTTNTQRIETTKLTLSAKEAAKAIGISPRLLWTLTDKGDVPHVRIGRRIVYPVAAIKEWMNAQTKGGRT